MTALVFDGSGVETANFLICDAVLLENVSHMMETFRKKTVDSRPNRVEDVRLLLANSFCERFSRNQSLILKGNKSDPVRSGPS